MTHHLHLLSPPKTRIFDQPITSLGTPDKYRSRIIAPLAPPHMEWSGNTFTSQQPEYLPKLTIHLQLDQEYLHKFGKPVRHHSKLTPFSTITTDSGCQTCTAGMDFLYQMNCKESDIVPTNYKIVGINNTPINITGVLFVTLHLGKGYTSQTTAEDFTFPKQP